MESKVTTRSITRRRAVAAALLPAALAAWAAVPVSGAQVLDRVIAVVSGNVIMLSDARAVIALGLFEAAAARDPVDAAMRWLIDRQLVLDETARGDRVDVDATALDQALRAVRQRFASDAAYRHALAGLGLDDTGVQRLVRDTLAARLYVDRRFESVLPATEEELRAYYARHAAQFTRNGRQLSYDDALADLTAMLQRERRLQAEAAWMERLRRRADIREVWVQADRR
jgi:hypothetical protein